MKFSIKDFVSKCDQIGSFLRIRPHLLKKSLMANFIFSAAYLLETKDFCDVFRGFRNGKLALKESTLSCRILIMAKHTLKILRCSQTCSKLAIKIPERRKWRRSDVFIVIFNHI